MNLTMLFQRLLMFCFSCFPGGNHGHRAQPDLLEGLDVNVERGTACSLARSARDGGEEDTPAHIMDTWISRRPLIPPRSNDTGLLPSIRPSRLTSLAAVP